MVLLLMGALVPVTVAKVYVRWTQSSLPASKTLGVTDLVIPWSDQAQGLATAAKKLDYIVYFESTLEQSAGVADAATASGIAGILLKGTHAEENQLIEIAQKLRAKYPKMKVLVIGPGGKQPEMRGWLVFNKNGILQVSSPSMQPWLDQNLVVVRYERTFDPGPVPLYTFSWDQTDPLVKQNGPKPADYSLAIAEAGAFHADLILELHDRQQKGLANGDKDILEDWEPVKKTIAFYEKSKGTEKEVAAVAALTDDYDTSYEAVNLLARHNIPFRVLRSSNVKPADLSTYQVVITFASPNKNETEAILAYAQQGGVAVLVNQPGTYPWDTPDGGQKNGASVIYFVGKGRVIELTEPVTDPETFAQDIRRLMTRQQVPVNLWNSLTTLVLEYPGDKTGETLVELINYDEEATQVQVQVKGIYDSIKLETPEKGCCETLKPAHADGFTEFVVPNLVNGGRIHLSAQKVLPKTEAKKKPGN